MEEKSIKCHYFKFVNSTKSCYLSETDKEKVRNVVEVDTERKYMYLYIMYITI